MKPSLDTLAGMVVKDGVGVGRLTESQRALVLGLAWRGVPACGVLREADVNAALTHALAGPCSFLGIDHVELRRWLVDCGWMQRDGFGREYRRVDVAALAPPLQIVAAVLEGVHVAVNGLRGAAAARREQRRLTWEGRRAETLP